MLYGQPCRLGDESSFHSFLGFEGENSGDSSTRLGGGKYEYEQ